MVESGELADADAVAFVELFADRLVVSVASVEEAVLMIKLMMMTVIAYACVVACVW